MIDTGPLFRRGPDVATVPGERVTHGCDDQSVGLVCPDYRLDGAPSNVREAEIKRVDWIPAVDDRVGVAINMEIELVAVVRDERHSERDITNLPITVVGLFGVGG